MRSCAVITHAVAFVHAGRAVQLPGISTTTAGIARDADFSLPVICEVVAIFTGRAGRTDVQTCFFTVEAIRAFILVDNSCRPVVSCSRFVTNLHQTGSVENTIWISDVVAFAADVPSVAQIVRDIRHLG